MPAIAKADIPKIRFIVESVPSFEGVAERGLSGVGFGVEVEVGRRVAGESRL
jgi:hypothetical protein